jgi:hypothetical protein
MKNMKHIGIVILSLALAVGFYATAVAQQPQSPMKAPAMEKPEKIMVKGKIAYSKSTGYVVRGQVPPGDFLIVNQDKPALESLMKKGKTLNIEGHLTVGADRLFVEKIDGKAYSGAKMKGTQ